MKSLWEEIKDGSITSPQGYLASGISCGLKDPGELDLALVVSMCPAEVAATFTTNQVKAAPVRVSMQRVKNGPVRAVILNAGNANACTGLAGIENAKVMTSLTADALGCKPTDVLVCSTGRIGVQLPMPKLRRGIPLAVKTMSPEASSGVLAAKAIMTSDTRSKQACVQFEINGETVTIGGMAKGAGMIHPNMATMLSVITTDANIDRVTLRKVVYEAVEKSFNRISVDGDTSTNDTVIVLANAQANNQSLKPAHPQFETFVKALQFVMKSLSRQIVEDGEGVSRVVEVMVKGAASNAEAKAAALAVAHSPLVKTSWCGGDPNWGRLMDAIGYSAAKVREELVEIYYDGVLAVRGGMQAPTPWARVKKIVNKKRFTITINLHLGAGEHTILTTDLTEEYVRINIGE
jgi:glutamate N-acetyltransferase/amino-acid N-acetyltransferase